VGAFVRGADVRSGGVCPRADVRPPRRDTAPTPPSCHELLCAFSNNTIFAVIVVIIERRMTSGSES